ncbi:MAG: hypothetical protein ACXADX_03410, partial [Candidatus Hodarchaeales archaeon]
LNKVLSYGFVLSSNGFVNMNTSHPANSRMAVARGKEMVPEKGGLSDFTSPQAWSIRTLFLSYNSCYRFRC